MAELETHPNLRRHQVDTLKRLEALIAERAETEARLDRERDAALQAAEAAFKTADEASRAAERADREALERRAVEAPAQARAALEQTKSEAEERLRLEKTEAEHRLREATAHAKQEQDDQRWEIGTLCEAAINEAKAAHDRLQQELNETIRRCEALERDAAAHLKACRLGKLAEMPKPTTEVPSEITPDDVSKALAEADASWEGLQALRLPQLFRGVRPFVTLLIPALVGLGIGGALDDQATSWIVGGPLGAVIGFLLMGWLYLTVRVQAKRYVEPLKSQLAFADQAARVSRQNEATAFREEEQRRLRQRDRDQNAVDRKAQRVIAAARSQYERTLAEAEETCRTTIDEAERQCRHTIQRVEEETTRRLPEIQRRFEQEQARAQTDYERATAEIRERDESQRRALADRWRDGLREIETTFQAVQSEIERLFPNWETAAKPDAPLPDAVPTALAFGRFRVALDMFPHGKPRDPSLMDGLPESFDLPALLESPDGCSLVLKSDAEGRAAALRTLQAVMLRILTGFPPSKARFTMIDPVGLGENFSAFMHLADFDERLVTSRIWTETAHIEQRLTDFTEHMENVIQKYLRNEFSSITEYNAKAGEVAEPFRFLVVADFPTRFNEAAARRLLSIASSGARCGVHVLIFVDLRHELPQGFDLTDLERTASVIQVKEGRFRWSDPDQGGFPLRVDQPPPVERFSEIVRRVGSRAEGAGRVEVPFDFLAPDPDSQWAEDSARRLEIPLGRAGATKVQKLRLGEGTSQHVLIAGKTGSGKSTLLHALILSAAMRYDPDQLEFYLIDFKKGVEFKPYATGGLPHARVVAIESEREFGLSVLQRIDEELRRRGDLFRKVGAQDLAAFREARPDEPMPRVLLIVDEFQEFFVEDDKIAQEAALLLDRLVRQGRAFGIHVHLGSQTLAGAYTLARATIGQMAVRIALQCTESDAGLILSDDNTAARLLSRPGEAIYNDANGRIEGNNIFQVVWLPEERRASALETLREQARQRSLDRRRPIVFEGNATPDLAECRPLGELLEAGGWPEPPPIAPSAWLGEPIAIQDPTAMTFRRQAASHLLIVGQNEDAARALFAASMISLCAQRPDRGIVLLDGTPADHPKSGWQRSLLESLPGSFEAPAWGQIEQAIAALAAEVERRRDAASTHEPPIFLMIYDLQRFRPLRKAEDDFGFSTRAPDEPAPPSEHLATILKDGPIHGVHAVFWCDSLNNLNRTFDRSTLRELETRVLFQMSAGDSSALIDSPIANRLGPLRALFVSEEAGRSEKFRPYGLPSADWLDAAARRFKDRPAKVEDTSV